MKICLHPLRPIAAGLFSILAVVAASAPTVAEANKNIRRRGDTLDELFQVEQRFVLFNSRQLIGECLPICVDVGPKGLSGPGVGPAAKSNWLLTTPAMEPEAVKITEEMIAPDTPTGGPTAAKSNWLLTTPAMKPEAVIITEEMIAPDTPTGGPTAAKSNWLLTTPAREPEAVIITKEMIAPDTPT